eukprot:768123-Amphidinium_carterae.1
MFSLPCLFFVVRAFVKCDVPPVCRFIEQDILGSQASSGTASDQQISVARAREKKLPSNSTSHWGQEMLPEQTGQYAARTSHCPAAPESCHMKWACPVNQNKSSCAMQPYILKSDVHGLHGQHLQIYRRGVMLERTKTCWGSSKRRLLSAVKTQALEAKGKITLVVGKGSLGANDSSAAHGN